MAEKPWDGRFSEKTDKAVERFTASIHFDKRLYPYDIAGSIAHCRMLAKCGIISQAEAEHLAGGLARIGKDMGAGRFVFDESLEDIHMSIEARLSQDLGPVARKLHTGRSRNDQVALDIRMVLRDETLHIASALIRLRKEIVALAGGNADTVLPGYTHLQRAQPVLLAHHLMAYYEMFSRDTERFLDGLKRINVMPLGAAALAGTTYPIDRHYTAGLLGFPEVSANSLDAVSDRDFALEFLSAASICMMHLSRLSEEMILWSSSEFAFVTLPDAFATGSSIMPQKKNPDVPELVRGKTGRVYGSLFSLLTVMKGLPLSYNRDMQEDKEPLFDAADTLGACLDLYIRMLPRLRFNREAMARAAGSGFLNATDLADYLVVKGMAFREAHHCAGRMVQHALGKGKELHDLTLEEMKTFSPLIEEDIFEALTVERMIARRKSFGGTAGENVAAAIKKAEKDLAADDARVEELLFSIPSPLRGEDPGEGGQRVRCGNGRSE